MTPPPPDIAIELLRRCRSSRRPREAGELVEVVVGRPAVRAAVPATPAAGRTRGAGAGQAAVRSGLLAALIALFESLWERAFELSALTATARAVG